MTINETSRPGRNGREAPPQSRVPQLRAIAAGHVESEPPKPAPHNLEAEQALLGAILVENTALDLVAGLTRAHFFEPLHGLIFETMEAEIRAGHRITPVILKTFFEDAEPINPQMTVPQYLGKLAADATSTKFVADYARTVKDLSDRRALIILGEDAADAAHDCLTEQAKTAVLDDIESKVARLRGDDSAGVSRRAISAASFQGKPVPTRAWHVPELVPDGNVTLLGGDGGTGKSLLALQLAGATVVGRPWLGRTIARGAALFISAEDDMEELHRRLADICAAEAISFDALRDLHLVSLAGEDAVMATFDRSTNIMTKTAVCREIAKLVAEIRPQLLVLDTLADLFGGDEINRSQTRQFVQMLRGIALKYGTTVLLLAHPSVAGMRSGSGTSGSTAWSNSVRSRLYLDRIKETNSDVELDPDARTLSTKKSNYARTGVTIPVRWHKGAFRSSENDTEPTEEMLFAHVRADNAFVGLLTKFSQQGREVSPHKSSSFAPAVFADDDIGKSVGKPALAAAMSRLLDAGTIKIEHYGPPSKRRTRLVLA
jgi:RecA-family ATPase